MNKKVLLLIVASLIVAFFVAYYATLSYIKSHPTVTNKQNTVEIKYKQ